MSRGQHESLSLLTGIIIAVLILLSLSFISCSIAKQQADVRSRINFDKVFTYLQQCQQLGQKDCYCPLLTLERFGSDEFLHLQTLADGTYLDLQKEGLASPVARKKISSQKLCTYRYSQETQQWKSAPISTYSIDYRHRVTFDDPVVFMAYLDRDGNVCSLQGFLESGLKFVERGLDPRITSQLRSCSTPQQEAPYLFYFQQRHTTSTKNPEQVMKSGQALVQELQTVFASQGKTYFSKIEPFVYTSTLTGISRPEYDKPQDNTKALLSLLSKNLPQDFQNKFFILSPLYAQTAEKQEKDSVTLYYLQNSVASKSLATFIQQRLVTLVGKRYIDQTLLSDADLSSEQSRFEFWITVEPLDETAATKKGLFLTQSWFAKDYSQLFQERHTLPAVFVDLVDHENPYALLDKHSYAFSQSFLLAVQDYLQQQSKKSGDLFKP